METDKALVKTVLAYYQAYGRHDMPWRLPESYGSFDPYKILVSEMMLQQTQVNRVIPKYHNFLARFPSARELAAAQLSEVLAEWVGLGYNRRAKYLHEAAKTLASKDGSWEYEDLVACKGIGPNTAAAVLAYSYDAALDFIETNVRTVIIHHYFVDAEVVSDKEVLAALKRLNSYAFEQTSPRQWYWALMDYGTHLKKTAGNASRRSANHTTQSRFEGSNRQVRGKIIRALAAGPIKQSELEASLADSRLEATLDALIREGLVRLSDNMLMLYNESEDTK